MTSPARELAPHDRLHTPNNGHTALARTTTAWCGCGINSLRGGRTPHAPTTRCPYALNVTHCEVLSVKLLQGGRSQAVVIIAHAPRHVQLLGVRPVDVPLAAGVLQLLLLTERLRVVVVGFADLVRLLLHERELVIEVGCEAREGPA